MAYLRVDIDKRAIEKLFSNPNSDAGRFMTGILIQIERHAIRLCPVDTGRLRSSITHDVGVDTVGLIGYVGTDVEYAPHVEFGTRFQSAQPFLRPALEMAKQ